MRKVHPTGRMHRAAVCVGFSLAGPHGQLGACPTDRVQSLLPTEWVSLCKKGKVGDGGLPSTCPAAEPELRGSKGFPSRRVSGS